MLATVQTLIKILETKDFSIVTKNFLDENYFNGYVDEFKFIQEHVKEYGNVPDKLTFLEKFPNFEFSEVTETDNYLLDRLNEEYLYFKFAKFIPELDKLARSNSMDAHEYLTSQLEQLKPPQRPEGFDIIKNAQERYDIYKNRSIDPENATIKAGLLELDDIFGGWEMGEELVTVVARTNQGKSWLLMKFLAEAWKQGKRVGLYSGEMNHIKLGYRFDALFGHFSNRCLSIGGQTDGYDTFIEKLKNMPTPFTIITPTEFHGRPSVQKIRNFVEANNLEIVGIDQYSLMEDGRSNGRDPVRIKYSHISEDLFQLSCDYSIPVLGLAQANREGLKKEAEDDAPGLENIKECDDIAHNSSKVIGMKQSSYGLVLDIIKNREGKVGDKLLYSWDIDTGHFSYIPSAGDAASPAIRQQVQQETKAQFAKSSNPF